jgi:hypothetical protein
MFYCIAYNGKSRTPIKKKYLQLHLVHEEAHKMEAFPKEKHLQKDLSSKSLELTSKAKDGQQLVKEDPEPYL